MRYARPSTKVCHDAAGVTLSLRTASQLKARIIANVSALDPAPGVAFHERAPDAMDADDFADRGAEVGPLLFSRADCVSAPVQCFCQMLCLTQGISCLLGSTNAA